MGLLDNFWGKKNLQVLFERMHAVALKGLNYGRASDYQHNGEEHVLRKVRGMIKTASPILFDVGANKGEFTRRILEVWRGNAFTLYAFEPSPRTFSLLQHALPKESHVQLVNLGMGDKPGVAELFSDKEGSGLASVYPRDLSYHNINFTDHETIALTTLDLFCEEKGIATVDFLKLDVEGHELAVLKGGKKMFDEGRVKVVQFEFGGCNIDSRTFFRDFYIFFAKDFVLYRILSDGLRPIEKYSEKLEVFQSANYLAVRK